MDQRLDINLTPLLDLVLQLIMFFMLTVSFVRLDRNQDGVDLPVAQSAMPLSTSADNVVYVTIDQHGERLAGSAKLDTPAQLLGHLQARKQEIDQTARQHQLSGPADMVVVVRAHKDAPWGAVVDTLDECARAGWPRWQLRVIKQAAS